MHNYIVPLHVFILQVLRMLWFAGSWLECVIINIVEWLQSAFKFCSEHVVHGLLFTADWRDPICEDLPDTDLDALSESGWAKTAYGEEGRYQGDWLCQNNIQTSFKDILIQLGTQFLLTKECAIGLIVGGALHVQMLLLLLLIVSVLNTVQPAHILAYSSLCTTSIEQIIKRMNEW